MCSRQGDETQRSTSHRSVLPLCSTASQSITFASGLQRGLGSSDMLYLISGHSYGGFIALGLRGHRRGPYRKSAGGPEVEQGAALIHQVAVPSAGLDCRPGSLLELPRWLPLSWGPCHWNFYQPVHGGHGLLLSFPRHLLASDDAALGFLGPGLQGLHHVRG